ncbi:hypothetical protein GCM10020220_101590 [Nonomuraea rubra]
MICNASSASEIAATPTAGTACRAAAQRTVSVMSVSTATVWDVGRRAAGDAGIGKPGERARRAGHTGGRRDRREAGARPRPPDKRHGRGREHRGHDDERAGERPERECERERTGCHQPACKEPHGGTLGQRPAPANRPIGRCLPARVSAVWVPTLEIRRRR